MSDLTAAPQETGENVSIEKLVKLDQATEIRACVDFAFRTAKGELLLLGWLFDQTGIFDGFWMLREQRRGFRKTDGMLGHRLEPRDGGGASLSWFPRPDVAKALSQPPAAAERAGFLLVAAQVPTDAQIAIRLQGGRFVLLPPVANQDPAAIRDGIEHHWSQLGRRLHQAFLAAFGDVNPLTRMVAALDLEREPPAAQAESAPSSALVVDVAVRVRNGLVLIGWAAFDENADRTLELIGKDGVVASTTSLADGQNGSVLVATPRLDLETLLDPEQFGDGRRGYVFFWPTAVPQGDELSIRAPGVDTEALAIPKLRMDDQGIATVSRSWTHSGEGLRAVARSMVPADGSFSEFVDRVEEFRLGALTQRQGAFDHALLLNNRLLILIGWLVRSDEEITRLTLKSGDQTLAIAEPLSRYLRADLGELLPDFAGQALGFVAVVPMAQGASARGLELLVAARGQATLRLRQQLRPIDWLLLLEFVNTNPSVAPALLARLASTPDVDPDPAVAGERIRWLQSTYFEGRLRNLPVFAEHGDLLLAAVDRAFPLGEAGLLIFGWCLSPRLMQYSVRVCSAGETVDVTGSMFPLLRPDVVASFGPRFPGIPETCGFVCLAPLPTRDGEQRALCFDLGEAGELWLRLPTPKLVSNDAQLAKEILGWIPTPERMQHKLFALFDSGLGAALEACRTVVSNAPLNEIVHQFGAPPVAAAVSVIVPLYGRFDFVRHQLARFADDPDFAGVDLIYVVDDPRIVPATLDLAARYQPLFKVPFRVVTYDRNLGFARANNVGARFASGDYVVLMNSDVIPQHAGWISTLRSALDSLPDAGAVGPLLQFGDGSIQHAGMVARRDDRLPGYFLNAHRQMGMEWLGETAPSEHPMLTAACLMLRRADYQGIGGFDEGYVIGDFEDSDLCLQLSKGGKRLWLVPKAKLWHLERLSQNDAAVMGQRQLITLYNGWRYSRKITTGELPDPTQWEPVR